MFQRTTLLASALALTGTLSLVSVTQAASEPVLIPAIEQPAEQLLRQVVGQIQDDPGSIKKYLLDAGRSQDYVNRLGAGDLEFLLAKVDESADAIARVAHELLKQQPDKLVSVHHELIGLISLDQLNAIEAMIGELVVDGHILIQAGSIAYPAGSSLTTKLMIGGGLAVGAAAAGGGGGGGDGGGPPPPPPFSPPSFPVTAAYSGDYSHAMIGTEQAHDRGYDGAGVTVAIIDTGFMTNHVELDGQFSAFFNVYTGGTTPGEVVDLDGHGTHVAGTLAAKLDGTDVTGVAKGATLIGIRTGDAIDGSLNTTDAQLAAGIDYAVALGAAFVNNSWGISTAVTSISANDFATVLPLELQAYRDAAVADTVMVFANGNAAPNLVQPNIQPGLPYLFPELEQHWVAVGAVGSDGELADYSQPCGVAADWCLVAPGGDSGQLIKSSFNDGGYALGAGTSMATPMVTGALAVLKQRFPTLTNDLVVDRLFLTANKTSIYANSAIYGQGLLDLDKATNPVGPLSVVNPLATGGSDSGSGFDSGTDSGTQSLLLSDLNLSLPAAFGNSFSQQFYGTLLATADIQGAGFFIDLGSLDRSNNRFDLQRSLNQYHQSFQHPGAGSNQTLALSSRSSLLLALDNTDRQQPSIDTVLYRYRSADNTWQLGLTGQAQQLLGLPLAEGLAESYSSHAFQLPYLSDEQPVWAAGLSRSYGALNWNLMALVPYRSGASESEGDDVFGAQSSADRAVGMQSQLAVLSLTAQASDQLELGLQLGAGREQQGVLGAEFEGALAISDNSGFSYAGLNGMYRLSDSTRISAAAYLGRSRPSTLSGSLISQVSVLTSSSFAIGADHQIDKSQQLGLVMSQPLRVERGQMTLALSTGYEGNQFNRESRQLSLAAPARQLDYELFYRLMASAASEIKASLIYQSNPGHQQVAANGVMLLSVKQRF